MTTPTTAIAMRERYTPAVMDGVTEAVLNGDLKGLPPAVKIEYYNAVCHGGRHRPHGEAVRVYPRPWRQGKAVLDGGGRVYSRRSIRGIHRGRRRAI